MDSTAVSGAAGSGSIPGGCIFYCLVLTFKKATQTMDLFVD